MANILGINLSDLNQTELLQRLDFFLNDDKSHFLVTPNPEIILEATRNEEYFHILNSADIAIADGFGLVLAGLLSRQSISRITGSDLTPLLIDKAEKDGRKILVINWKGGLSNADDIKEALKKRWPQLKFEVIDIDRKDYLSEEENELIKSIAPELAFVAIGAPLQEKLIWHELENWPSVRLALAVGGTFDFITAKIKRAPKIISYIGLEWLWRLISQPKRFKRIWRATVVFGLKALHTYLIKPFLYRPNVAVMLYKNTPEGLKILIVAREEDPSHWQLPQGGTDGERIAVAGAREAKEEVGTDKFVFKKAFKNQHLYKFDSGLRNCRKRFSGYKGQRQSLFIAEFIGDDSDIKINYWDHCNWKWVGTDELVETLAPYRQDAAKKYLIRLLETVK